MKWLLLALLTAFYPATVAAAGSPQNFVFLNSPRPVPEVHFTDGEGRPRTLADFHGKVVLLNVWAAWCVPCRKEMPTLDRLQAALGGMDFEVVTLSLDRGGPEVVKKFYAEIGIEHLAVHIDPSSKASSVLAVIGLPTTLLIDAQGQELGRLIGPADWDAPEMITLLRPFITRKQGRLDPQQREQSL